MKEWSIRILLSLTALVCVFRPVAGAGGHLADLERVEADPVLASPEEITRILEGCREMGDRACEARALLARADCRNQGQILQPEVGRDAAAAEAILRGSGPGADLARALLLMRGWGAQPDQAVDVERRRLTDAIEMAASVGAPVVEGRARYQRMALEMRLANFESAHSDLERLRELAASGDYPRLDAGRRFHEGLLLLFETRNALQARRTWDEMEDHGFEESAPRELLWARIGSSAVSINPLMDNRHAAERARAGVDLAERLSGDLDRAKAYVNLTSALSYLNRLLEVEEVGPTTLELSRRANLPAGEVISLRALGLASLLRGEMQRSLDLCDQSAELAAQIGDFFNRMLSLQCSGSALQGLERHDESRRHQEEAMGIADQMGFAIWRASARTYLALSLMFAGELEEAERTADQGLEILGPEGWAAFRSWLLNARGKIRNTRADYSGALEDLRQAYQLFQELDQARGLAETALAIGNSYFRLNRFQRALEYYRKTAELAARSGASDLGLIAVGNTALIERRFGRLGEHRERLLDQAKAIEELDRTPGLNGLLNLADTLVTLGELEVAERLSARALQAIEDRGGSLHRGRAHRVMARIYSATGRHDEARTECERALGEHTADDRARMETHHRCGNVFRAAGELDRAVENLREAARIGEETRSRIGQREIGSLAMGSRNSPYGHLVRALLERAGPEPSAELMEEAFGISERFRAWSLLDALAADSASSPEAPQGRRDLLAAMARLHQEMMGATGERSEFLLAEVRGLEDRLGEISSRPHDSAGQTLLGASTITVAAIQAALPDDETVFLEYLINLDVASVFAVTRQEIRVHSTPTSLEFFRDVRRFRSLLERRGDDADRDRQAIQMLGGRLYEILIEPMQEILDRGARRLVICPHDVLHMLPFEALPVPTAGPDGKPRYLVQEFEVAVVPSFSAYVQLSVKAGATPGADLLIALANPQPLSGEDTSPGPEELLREGLFPGSLPALPFSEDEVRLAAAHAGGGTPLLLGPDATEAGARQALQSGRRIVHLAAHGFLDPGSLGRSGLLLTPDPASGDDGLLQAREVVDLDVHSDLVVLSGCSTSGAVFLAGDGLIGLPHALFQAGARSIVMSLWGVRDRAAALFMDRFYEGLARGDTVGGALRAAKLDLIESGRDDLAHPSVWAPFVLAGIPDGTIELPGKQQGVLNRWTVGALVLLVLSGGLWLAGGRLRRSAR